MAQTTQTILVHAGVRAAEAEDLQRLLGANRTALEAAGFDLAYPGRSGAAGGTFDCAYPEPRHPFAEIEAFARQIGAALAPCRRTGQALLLCEHELPGRAANLLGGRFYPAAAARTEALGRALGAPVDRLVLSVEPYVDHFLHAWQGYALLRPMDPFTEYAPAMAAFAGGWVEVVAALRSGLAPRETIVMAAGADPIRLLDHLAPGHGVLCPALPPPAPVVTGSALAMIQRHYHQGGRFAPGQRERILAFHAGQPQIAPEPGFTTRQRADLAARYLADLAALARTPGVTLIGDPLPAVAAE